MNFYRIIPNTSGSLPEELEFYPPTSANANVAVCKNTLMVNFTYSIIANDQEWNEMSH